MKLLLLRRGRSALAAIVTALVVGLGLVAVPFLTSPASAVSGTTGPINVTITPTTGLVSGQTISIDATATSGTMSDILVHVCDPGIVPVNQFKFTSDVYCPNVTLTGGDTNNIVDKTLANTTTGHVDFKVGTGHAHWIDGFNPSPPANTHDLDCDSTHSCLLVMQFSSNIAPGTFYYSTPLTYAGQPGAPTLNTATAGDSQISTAWTPAADTGNGTIDQYTVTVTRTSGPADGGSPHVYTVAAPTTTKVATGLVNFATYDVKVTT
ncbi:MAG: fibronectin type III domain-containing protein, partial [Ilumatobacteraceae bacterium]